MNKKTGYISGNKSHSKGGIDVIVKDTNQVINVESKEYQICKKAMQSTDILFFKNKTNIEILDAIHSKYNCPAFDKTAQSGDFIICKIAVSDNKPRKRVMGTASQIVNAINGIAGGKVEGETAEVVMKEGGDIDDFKINDFDWESIYNPSPEEEERIRKEIEESEKQEKEDWYQKSKFSKKWASTLDEAIRKTVKSYLDAKKTYEDLGSRVYKSNKNIVFKGGDDIHGNAYSIGSINENRRRRTMQGSKMQMDEDMQTLKDLGLSDAEIFNLIDNTKIDNQNLTGNLFEKGGELKLDVENYKGIFDTKTTGISGLDDLLEDDGYNYFYKGVSGEVVMMSPNEYLQKVREGLKTKEDVNITKDKKDAINKAINKSNKINMPFISTKNGKFSQEGRNRVTIAKERGEKLIPVFIEKDISFEDKIVKGQEYINLEIKRGATTKEEILHKLKEQGLHRDAIRFIDNNFDNIKFNIFKQGGNVITYKNKFNKKYGFESNKSHSLEEIAKLTNLKLSALQDIYDKGIGAYKTNPKSVRPNVKSKEQWAMARVYSAVMGGKASKIDANELERGKMEMGGGIEFVPEKKGTLIRGNEIIKYAEKVNGNYRLVFYKIKESNGKVPILCDAFDYCHKLDTNDVSADELIELIKKNNLMEEGGEIKDLILSKKIELNFYRTTPDHALEYGIEAKNPLYLKNFYVTKSERLKGIGKKMLKYLDDYAIENGNDVIFGYINQKATFTKNKETIFNDTQLIKNWLHDNGYAVNDDNNDFHKVVGTKMKDGGEISLINSSKYNDYDKECHLQTYLYNSSSILVDYCLGHYFKINSISTKELDRRKGYATKLLDYVKNIAKELGFSTIQVYLPISETTPRPEYSLKDYKTAVSFYKKNGFEFNPNSTVKMIFDFNKFEKGGSILLAPNGQPSNLTTEQWHLVRQPEFISWFGNWEKLAMAKLKDPAMDEVTLANISKDVSKVVDENGEPLVVYHGTNFDFTIFKKEKPTIGAYGQGLYFTNDKNFASNYARGENARILSLFINVKNPFVIVEDELPLGYDKYSDMADNKGKSRDFTSKIISQSYDGVYAKNKYNENEYVVFEPEQIKLANGENTTFNPNNDDIRFEQGGNITDKNKEIYKKWKSLVNMSRSELENFYNSKEGKVAGLKQGEAKAQGIDSGRESARWIMKMKDTPISNWTPTMWKWANKQISFISRMSGNKGSLYDENGNKTRKHTSLLIWGHNPEKYEKGGIVNSEQNNDIIEFRLYDVQVGGNSYTESIYDGYDLDEAKRKFSYADLDDLSTSDKYSGGIAILREKVNKYKYIYQDEDMTIEDYPIEDYYEDADIYELIEEGEYEDIETKDIVGEKDIKEQNEEQADELLNETINYFKKLYPRHIKAGYIHRESYYFLIPIPNTENTIELRLSNHSPNFDNINSNKNEILKTEIVRLGENPEEIDVSNPNFYDQLYDNDMGFVKYRQIKPKNRVALINCIIYHSLDETYSKFDKNTEYNVINEYFDLNEQDYELSDITETIENIIQEQIDEYDGSKNIFKKGGKISKQLKKGIKVESEHKKTAQRLYNQEITPDQAPSEIAKDHIDENPNYYDDLEESGIMFEDGGNIGNLTHEQIEANIINQQFGYIS